MTKMEIDITKDLELNINKAARDTGSDCNALIVDAINVYLTILTLDKEKATILFNIINQQQMEIRKTHREKTQ